MRKHIGHRLNFGVGKVRAALLAALAGLAFQALAAEPIRVVTEEFPPYNMTENGKLTGFSTEVVEAVLAEIGERATIQSMPWARAYDMAQSTENVLIFTIMRTAAREKLFKWVGVVAPSEWSLFSLKDNPIRLSTLEDAKKYQTATVNQDAGEQYLVSNGFEVGKNLQSSNKYEIDYEKLRAKRVDLWVENDLVAAYIVRRAGGDPAKVLARALPLPNLGGGEGAYMAFGLKTSQAVVDKFKQGLEAIKKNGKYDALKRKWL